MAKLRNEMEARAHLKGLDPEKIRKFRHIKKFSVCLYEGAKLHGDGEVDRIIGAINVQTAGGVSVIDCDIAPDQTEKDEVVTLLAAIHLGFRDLFPKFKGQITPAMIEKRAKELDAENHPAPVDPTKEAK